ncbi:hypothetical protein SAMN05421800_103149 [Chryseobacterium balustinum]|uniref:Uncharacterized protein n=1 Tax=Chryseobacterium balustinum TaxID=246 RepID=A0AAX2IKN7_9FLAO|nr:hypothetical protein SAMN05421800_103149 [Chryseobacterium balustinum]SQA89765.1 Uncharacterised protein [Chryseobacterium balustinum]
MVCITNCGFKSQIMLHANNKDLVQNDSLVIESPKHKCIFNGINFNFLNASYS